MKYTYIGCTLCAHSFPAATKVDISCKNYAVFRTLIMFSVTNNEWNIRSILIRNDSVRTVLGDQKMKERQTENRFSRKLPFFLVCCVMLPLTL